MQKYNKPPPNERPNWSKLNEGQRRYAWEQYNLALVRRGLPINPVPDAAGQGNSNDEESEVLDEGENSEPDIEEDDNDVVFDNPEAIIQGILIQCLQQVIEQLQE